MSTFTQSIGACLIIFAGLYPLRAGGQAQAPEEASPPGAELLQVHPLLRELSEALGNDTKIVILKGYIGAADETSIRLFPSLDLTTYIDIPRDEIIRVTGNDANAEQSVEVFVRGMSEVSVTSIESQTIAACGILVFDEELTISPASCGSSFSPPTQFSSSARQHGGPGYGQECYWDCVMYYIRGGSLYGGGLHRLCQDTCQVSMPHPPVFY